MKRISVDLRGRLIELLPFDMEVVHQQGRSMGLIVSPHNWD